MRTPSTTSGPAIVADSLVKSFGDVHALRGVSLEVPPGTVLGLLGPNGAGKTTVVRILTTILRPDSGRAIVAGHDVFAAPQLVRRSIGLGLSACRRSRRNWRGISTRSSAAAAS